MADVFTEFELIDRLRAGAATSGRLKTGIGDDAAVTVPGGATATSVDAVVEGVHFRREFSSPSAIAAKAIAVALSDLAAMAAEPGEVYVTLGVPPATARGFLEALADGFAEAADRFGATLAGGDLVSSPVLFASVTVVGHAGTEGEMVLRSGAIPGDLVAVTGSLGGASAGLWLLEHPDDRLDADRPELVQRQVEPEPRLEAGLRLGRVGVHSMIDVSDGLVADLGHVAELSGVSIEVDSRLVPVQVGVPEVAAVSGLDVFRFALSGGEDYELAVTLPAAGFDAARAALIADGLDLTRIGTVGSGSGVTVVDDVGQITVPNGFDHFSG